MRGLILVDLDNVAGPYGLRGLVELAAAAQKKVPDVREWRVAFALNTSTPGEHGVTLASLREAGSALGATGDATEIALALTMPQTADVLIARLARWAPSDDAAGPYQAAILLTGDQDLADSLGEERYENSSHGWLRSEDGITTLWRMPEAGKPARREPPPPAKTHEPKRPELEQAYTLPVMEPSHASWAAMRTPDVDGALELEQLANLLDAEPWLLSQLGATLTSVRGIDRLTRLGGSSSHLGGVCPEDGVEVRGHLPRPRIGESPVAASVGIGAVRFRKSQATIASRFALGVIDAAGPCSIHASAVARRSVLQSLTPHVALGSEVKVRFDTRGRKPVLVAKVKHQSNQQPQAWWMLGNDRTTSEIRLEGLNLVPKALDGIRAVTFLPISPIPVPDPDGGRPRDCFIALRSVVEDHDTVAIPRDIDKGVIGEGRTMPAYGKARPVAVYAAARPLLAGETITVRPIHLAKPRNLPESCCVLPVVVPA